MIRRGYVAVDGRRVHFRWTGNGKPVVLLHASPESSTAMTEQLQAYGRDYLAIALDTPGCGLSDPLPVPNPCMADYAAALADTLRVLGIAKAALIGRHTGAAIAVETARLHPDLVGGVLCDGLPVYDTERKFDYLAHYVEPLPLRWDGAHLVSAWFRFREQFIHWPWFKQAPQHRADIDLPTAQRLHDGTLNLLLSGPNAGLAELAVFRYDMLASLRSVKPPIAIATREGDSLYRRMALLDDLPSSISVVRLPRNASYADAVELDALALDDTPAVEQWPPPARAVRGLCREYLGTADGELAVRYAGAAHPGPVHVLLPDVPGGGEALEELLVDIGRSAFVVSFDPPSTGDSTACAGESVFDAYRDAADTVLHWLNGRELRLVAQGYGALVAETLSSAGKMPVRTFEPPVHSEQDMADLDLAPDPYGTHLIRGWHYLRNLRLWEPGRTGRRNAIRRQGVDLRELQLELLRLMKHPAAFRGMVCEFSRRATVAGVDFGQETLGPEAFEVKSS